jgi:hypothetical protein
MIVHLSLFCSTRKYTREVAQKLSYLCYKKILPDNIISMFFYSVGSLRAWSWIAGIMSCISNFATLIVNNQDFTRFATSPSAVFCSRLSHLSVEVSQKFFNISNLSICILYFPLIGCRCYDIRLLFCTKRLLRR